MLSGTFLYDGDCGFCQKSVDKVRPWGGSQVRYRIWQAEDLDRYGVRESDLEREAIFVADSGRKFHGAQAFAAVLSSSHNPIVRGVGAAMRLSPVRPVAGCVYSWVAENRYRLSSEPTTCGVRPPARDTTPQMKDHS